jgi:predicted HTH domain antitoxin
MQVTLNLPEDISESLQGRWGDVTCHALEAIAVEGYRTGALTEAQVRRLLGLATRFEVHALLKEHKVPLHYTESDLEDDLSAHRDLGLLPGQ